jgi:hypothetical protein
MISLRLGQSCFFYHSVSYFLYPLFVIIEWKFDSHVFVNQVGHIAINKAVHLLFVIFGYQKIFKFFLHYCHLLVIVNDVDVSGSCQVTKLVIENPFAFVVPAS